MKLFTHILILFTSTALACDSYCKCKGTVGPCITYSEEKDCAEICATRGGDESCSWWNVLKYKYPNCA
jgi:hypothetical protein